MLPSSCATCLHRQGINKVILDLDTGKVANCTLWFLKPPHIEAKEELIYSVKILGGSSSVLETIGNSAMEMHF